MPVTDALPPEPLAIHGLFTQNLRNRPEMNYDRSTPDIPLIRTVLVVDDAGVVRRLSFRVLSEAGFRVFEAASAVEALEVMAMLHGHLDLVLVDVIMPEVNGVDLVRLIRERWNEPSILFMSAYPAEVLAREGVKDLRVQFLAKPFTRDELLNAAYRALEPSRRGEQRPATPRQDS
jgi:two-component system cell cycle sensor histidine kinase/response regulator CckA